MKVSILKHLKLRSEGPGKNCFYDGYNHHIVVSIEAADAAYEAHYKNEDYPFKVVQLSGETRLLSEEEFCAASCLSWGSLIESAVAHLENNERCQKIAATLAKEMNSSDWKKYLIFAARLDRCESYNELESIILEELFGSTGIDSQALLKSLSETTGLK